MAGCEVISTDPYHGYAVLFSPFSSTKLAFVGSLNYGISGSGVLLVYEQGPEGFREFRRYPWKDGVLDVTWSEVSEPVLVAASGDGTVLVFNQTVLEGPVALLSGHTADVASVEWSQSRQEQLVLSAAWDSTVRIWDPQAGSCVSVFTDHQALVYQAAWAPRIPHTFASVSGDGTLRLWDSTQPPRSRAFAHPKCGELLTLSWNKYNENELVVGGVDTCLRVWDIRNLAQPVAILPGHSKAVKKVKCDPHSASIMASCSYDSTVRIWDLSSPKSPSLDIISHHTEFTLGLDISLHLAGVLADCSWDKTVKIYSPACLENRLFAN